MFSQRMASLPPCWAARLKMLGENATGISFSSPWACAALPMCRADSELAFSFAPISGKSVLFDAIPVRRSVFPVQGHKYAFELAFLLFHHLSSCWPRTQTRRRRKPFAPVAGVGFPQLQSCVSKVAPYVFYFTWSDSYYGFVLVSKSSSPKPVTSRGFNDSKQTEQLAGGMGSPGQPCFARTVRELCKSDGNCSTASISVAGESRRQVSPTITAGRKTTGLSYACKDMGCVTRAGFGPSWHSQPSSASLGLGKGGGGRWEMGRQGEPADGGLAREVQQGVWGSTKGNKKNRKREEKMGGKNPCKM